MLRCGGESWKHDCCAVNFKVWSQSVPLLFFSVGLSVHCSSGSIFCRRFSLSLRILIERKEEKRSALFFTCKQTITGVCFTLALQGQSSAALVAFFFPHVEDIHHNRLIYSCRVSLQKKRWMLASEGVVDCFRRVCETTAAAAVFAKKKVVRGLHCCCFCGNCASACLNVCSRSHNGVKFA